MLRIRGLGLSASNRRLLAGLDCTVLPGECWVVFGSNGAGKTTLMRTLAGLREPDEGEVCLKGRPLAAWDRLALARERAFLSQTRRDAFSYRVWQVVMAGRFPYHARRYRESEEERFFTREAMRQMDILSLEERDIRTLSGGERQRVALAAVLAQDTPLLLLDEPANMLDLPHQAALMRLVRRLCREEGKGVVMVLHDLNLAAGTATHALLMGQDGKWQAGEVSEVMQAETLSACFGYPVTLFHHEGRTVYLPA